MINSERELLSFQTMLHNLQKDRKLVDDSFLSKDNKQLLDLHLDNLVYWLQEEIRDYERLCVEKQNGCVPKGNECKQEVEEAPKIGV
jgi:hypothetical protein